MISDGRGGGGVIKNLMKSDEGGEGGLAKSDVRSSLFRKKEKSRPLPNNKQTKLHTSLTKT